MTKEEVVKLHNGDEVYWTDPDEGLCSRYYTIQTIIVIGPADHEPGYTACIMDKDGSTLECFIEELS